MRWQLWGCVLLLPGHCQSNRIKPHPHSQDEAHLSDKLLINNNNDLTFDCCLFRHEHKSEDFFYAGLLYHLWVHHISRVASFKYHFKILNQTVIYSFSSSTKKKCVAGCLILLRAPKSLVSAPSPLHVSPTVAFWLPSCLHRLILAGSLNCRLLICERRLFFLLSCC